MDKLLHVITKYSSIHPNSQVTLTQHTWYFSISIEINNPSTLHACMYKSSPWSLTSDYRESSFTGKSFLNLSFLFFLWALLLRYSLFLQNQFSFHLHGVTLNYEQSHHNEEKGDSPDSPVLLVSISPVLDSTNFSSILGKSFLTPLQSCSQLHYMWQGAFWWYWHCWIQWIFKKLVLSPMTVLLIRH